MRPSGKTLAMISTSPTRLFITFAVVLLLAANHACVAEPGNPNRPKSVPVKAVWVGGPDGGVWIVLERLAKDPPGTYQARIYHQGGGIEYKGPLILKPASSKRITINPAEFEGWDGDEILLRNGRSLRVP